MKTEPEKIDRRYSITRYLAGDPTTLHTEAKGYRAGNFIRNIISGHLFYTKKDGVHVDLTDESTNPSDPSSPEFIGTNYIVVYGAGTPTENAAELQAAYDTAKTMPRYLGSKTPPAVGNYYVGQTYFHTYANKYYRILQEVINGAIPGMVGTNIVEITEQEAKSTRTTVVVASGRYTFGYATNGSTFELNTSFIDVVSLTGNDDLLLDNAQISADNVYVKGINCGTTQLHIIGALENVKLEKCIGGAYSFGEAFAGIAIGCIGGEGSFGASEGLTGRLEYCRLTSGTFPTPTGNGRIINSIDGTGAMINIPDPNIMSGTNYVMVYGTGTPTENAAELQAAYEAAKSMPRYLGVVDVEANLSLYKGQTVNSNLDGELYYLILENITNAIASDPTKVEVIAEAEAISARTVVVIAPGVYDFGPNAFLHNTQYIDIKSLTGEADVIIKGREYNEFWGYYSAVVITANNSVVTGINTLDKAIQTDYVLHNLVLNKCKSGAYSLNDGTIAGTFNDCEMLSFGYSSAVLVGTFNRCKGEFVANEADGTYAGMFNYCEGYFYMANGNGGGIIGTLFSCKGNSIVEDGIIGPTGRLYYCKSYGAFPDPEPGGKLVLCIDGSNQVITT